MLTLVGELREEGEVSHVIYTLSWVLLKCNDVKHNQSQRSPSTHTTLSLLSHSIQELFAINSELKLSSQILTPWVVT